MCFLLGVQCLSQADPKGTSKEAAKNSNDDGIGPRSAELRIVKTWAAVIDVFVVHERTRERAHAQQYGVDGMPCQRFFLPFAFFFSRLGLLLTLATVST